MRKFMIMLAAACLLTVPVMAAQTYTYDWADGDADYLGCFDNDTGCLVSTLCNRTGSAGSGLALEKQTYLYADGVAKGFLATVWNLVEGDEVTVSVWRYDSNANMPYFRLWAHYNDHLEEAADARGQDMLANDGDMQGNNDFGNQNGWEQFSHTWTVEAGHTGMVIDAAVFGDYLATVYIDDLEVTVPDHASVRLPNAIYAAGGEVTPVQMETWTSVKNLFD
jgi:hypothetical protein